MKLSFNIPTYNRGEYLKKNIEIIINQIQSLGQENEIEINVSDNGSTDSTEINVKELSLNNPNVLLHYSKNNINQGPDLNYIKVMHMAKGEYSILWGDNDFLKDNALKFILNQISSSECSFYISNRTNIDAKGNFISEQFFLSPTVPTRYFDFSNIDEARSYFTYNITMGGCFTFISSVIYKTHILSEIGNYDDNFTNTYYAFYHYWWRWILKGNKIKYINKSYLFCTTIGKLNDDTFGMGIVRVLVDFKGFLKVANLLFEDSILKQDFLDVVFRDHPYKELMSLYYNNPKKFKKEMMPILIEYGWDETQIKSFEEHCSIKRNIKNIIKLILNHNK